jgi:hypothetical protein
LQVGKLVQNIAIHCASTKWRNSSIELFLHFVELKSLAALENKHNSFLLQQIPYCIAV